MKRAIWIPFLVFLVGGVALAQAAGSSLLEARFTDHCLEKAAEAEAHWLRAIDAPETSTKERAEARYAVARIRALDGRREAAIAMLEQLVERITDPSLGKWPAKAKDARDRLARGEEPWKGERSILPLTIDAQAQPIERVLRDMGESTGLSFAFDATCPPDWSVSAKLVDASLDEALDALAGKGRWRRMGDAVAIGKIADDGVAWERGFSWESIADPAGRALGAKLTTTRVSVTMGSVPLGQAVKKLNSLGVCEIVLPQRFAARPVRVFARDLRMDRALDLLLVPAGLEWIVEGGKVVVRSRKEPETEEGGK